MDRSPSPLTYTLVLLQLLLVSAGIAVAALMPPAQGNIIAIPLLSSSRNAGMAALIAEGARIERAGPVAGSLILVADRNAILPEALKHGILLLPTAIAGCRVTGVAA
ncbi:MAG TPA: hypothetical protein VF509_01025 [Sphingobium sp.]